MYEGMELPVSSCASSSEKLLQLCSNRLYVSGLNMREKKCLTAL